jgi:hypothetical protein
MHAQPQKIYVSAGGLARKLGVAQATLQKRAARRHIEPHAIALTNQGSPMQLWDVAKLGELRAALGPEGRTARICPNASKS